VPGLERQLSTGICLEASAVYVASRIQSYLLRQPSAGASTGPLPVGYSETDSAAGGTNHSDTRISAGGVGSLARHSVADEVVGRRLRRRGHGARFRAASVAWRHRAAG